MYGVSLLRNEYSFRLELAKLHTDFMETVSLHIVASDLSPLLYSGFLQIFLIRPLTGSLLSEWIVCNVNSLKGFVNFVPFFYQRLQLDLLLRVYVCRKK